MRPWIGRVWLNPPYGQKDSIGPWLYRMADHNRGTALIFVRTETKAFFETVWARASALLFLRGRLLFHKPDGSLPNAGAAHGGYATAPSVLVAYGDEDATILKASELDGHFVFLRSDQ